MCHGMSGSTRRQEIGHAFEIVGIVAEAGNDERDDLDPEAALLEHLDGVGDVFHHAAELAVVFGVEGFEIDLVRIDVGPDEIEHLRRAVAVGDVGALAGRGIELP